jgi:signal transduction histidine kinase
MAQPTFITQAEKESFRAYDRERRLRILRIFCPGLFCTVGAYTVISFLRPSTPLYIDVLNVSAVLLLVGGTITAWRNRVTAATLCAIAFALIGMIDISLLKASDLSPYDLADLPFFLLIAIVALIGAPWMILATTGFTCATVIGLTVYNVSLHGDPQGLLGLALADVLLKQIALGAILFAISLTYGRVMRDINDVRIQYARAKQLDDLKDQFISSVNHELRNPIMALYNYVDILDQRGEQMPVPRRQQAVRAAKQVGDRVLTLVRSILDTRRLDQNAAEFTPEAVSLHAALDAAIDLLDPREGDGAERELHVRFDPEIAVWGEPIRVQQILTNLLSNALKYSPPGSPVEVSARHSSVQPKGRGMRGKTVPMVEIAVRDYGLGVPPDQVPLLFQRFVRLQRDLLSSVIGNGLGLYLCRVLAEAMGGSIRVESSGIPNEGSTFIVQLPAPPAQASAPPPTLPAEEVPVTVRTTGKLQAVLPTTSADR